MNGRIEKEFEEVVIEINRVSKKTQGGNQMRFAALVVVGDKKGRVGVGMGKAPDVVSSINKAASYAKKHLINVPMVGTTIAIPQEVKFGAARVLVKPAPPGSGIIAGGPLRAVFEVAGVQDVVSKILGTSNKISNVYAVIKAITQIEKIIKLKEKQV